MQQLRGLCGSLQYAAVHSRPDLASRVANLQKGINKPTVETLLEGSRVLKEAQTYAETSVIIRSIPIKKLLRQLRRCQLRFGETTVSTAGTLHHGRLVM